MPVKKKDLHLATSLSELNKTNEKAIKVIKEIKEAKKLLSSLEKIRKDAELKESLGDEEQSYVLYTRYIEMVFRLKRLNYMDYNYSNLTNIVVKCEDLSNSLDKRYKNLRNQSDTLLFHGDVTVEQSNLLITGTKLTPSLKYDKPTEPNLNSEENSITCDQLYNLLCEENPSVVVFDVRSTNDFVESHIQHSAVASIPADMLRPGFAASVIEKFLPFESRVNWDKRDKVDYVVLLDWDSAAMNMVPNSPLDVVNKAISQFTNVKLLKSCPFILEHGYEEWCLRYPTLMTNPLNQRKKPSTATLVSVDVDYPDVNEEAVKVETINLQHVKEKDSYPPLPPAVFLGFDDDDSRIICAASDKRSDPTVKPETNHTTDRPKIPTIDRSAKPQALNTKPKPKTAWYEAEDLKQNEQMKDSYSQMETMAEEQLSNTIKRLQKEKEFESLCRRKENERSEELREFAQDDLNQVLETLKNLEIQKKNLEEGSILLEKENQKLKQQLSKHVFDNSESEASIKLKLEEKKLRDAEVEKLRNERKKRDKEEKERKKKSEELEASRLESLKINQISTDSQQKVGYTTTKLKDDAIPMKRGLSRSHSSPNINQLVEDSSKTLRNIENIPVINRQAKPTVLSENLNHGIPTVNRILKPSETTRQRNLNPVYSSQGNSQTGLRNLGNTCFMNSVIQCLSQSTLLVQYLLYDDYRKDINGGGEIIEELSILIENLRSGNYRSISPSDFKNKVSRYLKICIGNQQQDAHEFLTKLVEKLHSEINRGDSHNKSPPPETDKMTIAEGVTKFWSWHRESNNSAISSIFEGLLLSKLICLSCKSASNTYEVFSCLSVPIPSNSRCSINACISSFLKTERISGDAGWNCPTCKQKREAEKQTYIVRLPGVLVIHLKRFSYEGMWRSKLKTLVDFNFNTLNMTEHLPRGSSISKTSYYPFGVVNHFGTLEGGHYTAMCKSSNSDKWFKYDDQEVTEISPKSIVTDAAYIIFYNLNP